MDNNDYMKEEALKAGIGAISKLSEYTADGMKSPQAKEVASKITSELAKNDQAAKLGADSVKWLAGAAGTAGAAGIVSGGAAAGAIAAAAPFVPIVAVGGLAIYGLKKLLE